MDEEDLDRFVARCASLLLSDDCLEVLSGVHLLKEAHKSRDSVEFSRKAQELAAYEGGSLLKALLEKAVDPSHRQVVHQASNEGVQFWKQLQGSSEKFAPPFRALSSLTCTSALVKLADSKVVVDCCLREGTYTRDLAEGFASSVLLGLECFCEKKSRSFKGPFTALTSLLQVGLQGFVNFAKSSRSFREAMKQLPNLARLFEGFESILSKNPLKALRELKVERPDQETKLLLSSLAVSLAFSSDSHLWSIDMGLLRIIAAIYESTHRRELTGRPERINCPAFRCNNVLARLLGDEASLEKLRGANALSVLRPHKNIISAVQPESQTWGYIKAKLSGKPVARIRLPSSEGLVPTSAATWKISRRLGCGLYSTQIVCSWKLCTAGPQPDVGKGFSRCSGCQAANYCR
jgi:hypothetical protein